MALTFDGSALIIYVNGIPVGNSPASLIPANGLIVTLQEVNPNGSNYGVDGYDTYPSALLIGADAKELGALDIGPDSAWTNYCAHYKGWVDEVRVWDGARTEAQIKADYTKRYTLKDVSELRDMVYREWLEGGTHNPNDGRPNLSPELVFHYGFQQLPSEVEADYVTSEPSGFTERVLDNVKWNGRSVDIRCGWWNAVPIASTVYGNRAIVPWVRDTCAMLPMMDGSTYDSRYWSELIGGVTFPVEVGVAQFLFPNVANPYPYWNYMAETFFREQRLNWMRGSIGGDTTNVVFDVYNRIRFGTRTLFVGGSDLLPLGGAFAKRCPDFWDGNGSTDAWTATVDDTDNDGLPDWWEAHAVAEYGADAATLIAATMVNYKLPSGAVVEMSAWEAYQIDLALGIMPGEPPTYDPAYESLADNNNDGLPDWWQKLYDVYDLDPDDDPDNDGLSNYYEWLISWGDEYGFGIANGFPLLNPRRIRTGRSQEVTDYFLRNDTSAEYAGYYFGEITSDHDFMEDWWEKTYKQDYASIGVYDPWDDKDEDGWSNFAECRNALWGGTYTADAISRYFDGEQMSLCYPSPALGVRVTYNGAQNVVGKPLVVRTHTGFQKREDATFVVVGASADVQENTKFIGGYYTGATTLRGFIDPGAVIPAEGHFKQAWLVTGKTYRWDVPNYYTYPRVGSYEEFMADVLRFGRANVILLTSELDWKNLGTTRAIDSLGKHGVIDAVDGSKQIGTIDFSTGEYSLDMAAIATLNENDLEGCVFKVDYQTRVSRDWPQSFWLSAPKEGRVREGKNTIEAFIDLNEDGNYTPGEPFGVAQNVDVGWYRTSETLIELTDTISVVPRMNIASLANDRTVVGGVSGGVALGSGEEGNSEGSSGQSSGNNANGLTKQVRIVRRAINGVDAPNRILMNKSFVLNDRAYIHEGDVLSPSRLDLDWQWLATDAAEMEIDTIRTVEYAIEEVRKLSDGATTNIQLATFLNHYNPSRSVPTAVRPVDGEPVHSATPTFRWAVGDETMTAFELQVRDADGVVVYDSGIQRLPGRTATFVDTAHYAFNPLLSVDTCTSTNGSPVFADGTNWQWRVALFNAKYNTVDEAAWSQWADFRTDTVNDGIATGYGSCTAAVRYYGPGTIDDPGLVVVDAFTTPDFSGQPLARARLSSIDKLSSIDDVTTTNTCFRGIEPGTVYLRAFFDRNNNGKWDRWEPWGYANRRDELASVSDIFSPRGMTVTGDRAENVPSITIYIEDTDVNRNKIVDVLEDEALFGNTVSEVDADGDGMGEVEENDIGTDPSVWDSDGDGMPDGWEFRFAATDPLMADASKTAEGDVMAYAEENWMLVTDASDAMYLVNPTNTDVRVGDVLPLARLVSTYDYAGKYGVGTNLTDTVTTFRVSKVEDVTAVFVHAQVYDRYGYSPLTAVPAENAVHTKPFTSLDKYLLIRYFESLGFCNEAEVNANRIWADFSLKPNDPDNDRDGVYDGWELYVMFGTNEMGVVNLTGGTIVSPWNSEDRYTRFDGSTGGLALIEDYDDGYMPTDPWHSTTEALGLVGIDDVDAFRFRLKSIESQLADDDNDGLSNWAEYLAYKLTGKYFDVKNPCSVTPNRLDYFYQFEQGGVMKYIGECIDIDGFGLIADHDFMEDYNEDLYDVDLLNRYSYDPFLDADGDGWSNYAEARAGTASDRTVTLSIEDSKYPEYPIPVIKADFLYRGSESLGGGVILQAYRAGSAKSDAEWKSATPGLDGVKTKILGTWRNGALRFMLSPSNVRPGSVNIQAKDLAFVYTDSIYNWPSWYNDIWYAGTAAEAEWFDIVSDRQRDDDRLRGDLIYNKTILTSSSSDSNAAVTNNEIRIVGWVDYLTGQCEIDFTALDGYFYRNIMAGANFRAMRYNLENSYFRVRHNSEFVTDSVKQTFYFSECANGMLLEGKYNFMAFIDANSDGTYTIGEPMGVVRDVNVGWDRVPDLLIELTDDTVAGARFTVPAQTNGATRVRVLRTAINGVPMERKRTVYVKTLDLTKGRTFSEVDFIKDGEYDFDWANLAADAQALLGIEASNILNADYAVYLDSGDPTPIYTFSRSFDAMNLAPAVSWASISNHNVVATAQPTLKWKASAGYPAFALQIAKDEDFTDVIYSVTNLMPAATADGCQFKPDVYAGYGLEDGSNYFWRVQQVNAKFTTNIWSSAASFTMKVDSSNADTGYGKLRAEVRYFGPATDDLTNVVVGVYESADFVSMPVARMRLSGDGKVTDLTNDLTQAFSVVATSGVSVVTLDGIKPGTYYLMAFIDSNGNSVRDPWETWGYANKVGTDGRDIYTPVSVTVKSAKSATPSAYIVMEDTDVNQNWIPDCIDTVDLEGWKPSSEVKPDEPTADVDTDGDGLTDAEEDDYGTDPRNPDTDGDGLPDGFEVQAGTDPLFADSDLAGANDVMAYKLDTLTIMVATNAEGSVTNRFVVNSRFEDGYPQMSNTVYTVFEVNGQLFVGAPTNRAAATDGYMYGYMTTNVVVMHSAVYDFYGYDPTTAKPGTATVDDEGNATTALGANTVPFSAYLKYVTQQYYLKEFGDATNDFALAINKLDSNANYLPDGYELYVRYATWHDPSVSYSDADARSSYGDNAAGMAYDPYEEYLFFNRLENKVGVVKFTNFEACRYNIIDGDLLKDEDNDGLSNYHEFLASKAPYNVMLDVMNAMSDGATLDYFRTAGGTYLGLALNGGEFIENEARTKMGIDILDMAGTRYRPSDGWDYWSIARYNYANADTNGLATPLPTPEPPVTMTLRWRNPHWTQYQAQGVTIKAYQVNPAYPEQGEDEMIAWAPSANNFEPDTTFGGGVAVLRADKLAWRLSSDPDPDTGVFNLKPGKVRFEVTLDDTDFAGSAETVIGWAGVDVTVTLTDRANGLSYLPEIQRNDSASHVAIIRTKVNGQAVTPRGVWYKVYSNNIDRRTVMPTEFMDDEFIGIDKFLAEADETMLGTTLDKVESVTYEVLTGTPPFTTANLNGDVAEEAGDEAEAASRNQTFTMHYSLERDKAEIFSFEDGVEGTATLTFGPSTNSASWKFWVKVENTFNGNCVTNIYGGDRGFLIPTFTAEGRVTIDPAEYGIALTEGTNVVCVALGNDKFGAPAEDDEAAWSAPATFYTNKAADFPGSITLDVRHPLIAPADLKPANLVVAAYELPDLAKPVVIGAKTMVVTNSTVITGLRPRAKYYVAAWYVSDKDARLGTAAALERKPWDTWGYAADIGSDKVAAFTPVAVAADSTEPVVVYLQDTDWNDNIVIDREEIFSAADNDYTGSYFGAAILDFDRDGLPDAWEELFGNDPTLADDAGVAADGDVMAYFEEQRTAVIVTNSTGEATTYLLPHDALVAPKVGDEFSATDTLSLFTSYEYGNLLGEGTNVTLDAGRVVSISNATVAIVHWQVYDRFGFDPKTCVKDDDAVNTKEFTALDKYLLLKHFAALGFNDGADTLANWEAWTLKPGVVDADGDGIADGWELYTMFGPNDKTTANMKLSPWNYADRNNKLSPDGLLSSVEEYDGGNSPTDPYSDDTDLDGITDAVAYDYQIKSAESQLADYDNDGLSNWAEYLASLLTGVDFDVRNPYTFGNRLDYFYRYNGMYVGESVDADGLGLIADHDFMEDYVEDVIGYNRYVYDASIDKDGNGWDNWSEVRARYNEATWVVVGEETNTYTRTFNSFTPEAKAQWQMWYDNEFFPKVLGGTRTAWLVSARYYNANGEEKFTYTGDVAGYPINDSSCEVIWYELDDKKSYGGKPLPNVNVRIYGVEGGASNITVAAYSDKNLRSPDATFEVEGKAVDGVVAASFVGDGMKQGLNTFVVTAGAKTGFAKASVGFDRVDVEIVLRDGAIAFTVEPQTDATTRVRVLRTAINGTTVAPRAVYAKTLDLRSGKTFTEADLVKDGEFDFDQTYLEADAIAAGIVASATEIRSVGYAVYLDWGDAQPIYTFTRTFDAQNLAPAASGASAQHGYVVASAQPALTWKASAGYPAFALQIATENTFADDKIVYATTNVMPGVAADGCTFKPEIYVGDGLDDATTYFWRVAQLNSKFTTNKWSEVAEFTTAVNVSNADTGYGRVAVDLRYFGPSAETLDKVVVGVYESADFTTEPVARMHLVGAGGVSALARDPAAGKEFTEVTTNVVIDGIAPGDYYVMAFIDANGNHKRDAWETWGYVNKIGTDAADLYTPVSLKVVSTKAGAPSAFLVMEDTDVNQNWTPDCIEPAANFDGWTPAQQIEPDQPTAEDIDSDGDGLTDAEEDDYGTDPRNPDTDGDGLPDGWEVKNGTDPLFADADLAGLNDVMAYKVDALKVMFTTNDVGEVTGRYVVNSRFEDGYEQQSNTVYTVFEVGGQLYVGAPTNRVDVTNAYAYAFMTNVVVMHSAVYDFYGYDPTTAKPGTVQAVAGEDGAATEQTVQGVNTVPFTAYLKYVTQMFYLKEFGDATNDFALAINKLDSNANYLPDGYELYVRYAVWHDPALTYDDADARASYGDNFAQVPYDPYDEYGFWNSLVAASAINSTATNFVAGVANAELVAALDVYTNDWNYANGVMAYAQTTAHVATNGTDKFVVVIAGADDPDGVAEGAVKTVLRTVTLPNGELVAWGETADVDVVGLPIGEEPVTLIHRAVYHFYGFEADTARGCINDGAASAAPAAADGEDGEETAAAAATTAAGTGHTAPFTHAWRYFTKEIVGYADPVEVVYDFEDGTGDGLADGWQLYVGGSDRHAYQYRYDPADDYYFYNNLAVQDPEFAASLPPYDNTFAITNGIANATVEAQKAFWDWAPEDDYMAYVQTNVLISVVTNAGGVASIYAIDPGTNTLYETFYVGNELFVGAVCTNEYAYNAMENGDFMTMVTNATVIHSAVYDWYGFDPTTAKPSYWWPESIAYLAESNSNYTVGANSVPFTRRLKYITQTMYLPMVGAEDDYFLTTSWTADPSTWWTDTNGNDMPDGWELYVKYSASSDPSKPDDDYREDFTDGSDPNTDDTDGDGIPDDVEQFFGVTDPTVPDGNLALENDVMAFATVNATVVTVQNTAEGSLPVKYLLAEEMAGNTVVAPKVGDYADSLALRATYEYLVSTDANDGSVTNRCGVGTNVTLTAAAGTANRIVAVATEPVVLVHAQVYDYFGFNKDTANPTAVTKEGANYVYGANTKPFTVLDKYLVVRYLEAYGLANAAADWKALALAPASSDNDADGVPDGWELYTMFGTEGVTATLAAAKISPYNYADARAVAPAGDITLLEKWNGGAPAYDPWSKDSNDNGVDDVDEIRYVLDEPYGDADNDQLPNFTEFLIASGFSQYSEFAGVSDISATNTYSLTNLIPDYFRRINNKLYLGEMFTDHDFMEDLWEDLFDVKKVTRGLYDPWRDSDSDGWSNYAECRAGTNPEFEANTYGVKGIVVKNYPIPTIHAKVVMGPGEGMLNGTIVVQAFSDTSKLTGLPDATWTVPVGTSSGDSTTGSSSSDSSENSAKTKYLGANPNGEVSFTLSPGFVKPGSISMSFLDPDFEVIDTNGVVTALGDINTAEWQALAEDRQVTGTSSGKILVSTPTNSLEIGTVDYHTGLVTVDYTKLPTSLPVVAEGNDATNSVLLHLANSHVRVSWEAEVAGGNPWMTLHLTDSDDTTSEQATYGHVREGKNTFVVFVAGEGGKWAPGNAYGVVKDVDVGWSEAEFTVELTKTTPIMARFNLSAAISATSGSSGGEGSTSALTDRDTVNNGRGYAPNEESKYPGTNMPSNVSLTRVRVIRNWINRSGSRGSTSYSAVLFDQKIDLSVHPTLTEADLLTDGVYDLDWGTLLPAFGGGASGLTNATYRIVIGDDELGDYEDRANNLPVLFSNLFEAKPRQTLTVPDPKLAEIEYAGRPTFRWSHTNTIDKAYPAFQLRIYKSDKTTIVYDSGVQRAPARDSDGMYEWTAPVYAGMVTSSNHVFEVTNNYYWAVSMLDAKFTTFNYNETKTPFRLGTSGNLLDGKDYGAIAVRVKYFGPLIRLSAVPTTKKNLVRVQAFTSPDFSGLPVAETYVTDVSKVAYTSVIVTNAVIRGVACGGTYYVRAYIDTDADGVKSDWESWGYNCFVLDPAVTSVWRPKPVTVSYQDMMPDATVFIEDADTDNDGFPDAWEWNENGNLSDQGPISGNTFFATVNPTLTSTLNAYSLIAGGIEGATAATGNMRNNRLQASISASAQILADASENTAVQIKAFSLEDGLELEVVNTTSGGDSSSMIVFSKQATVQLSLACSATPDFADAVEVPIKSITIYANQKTTDGIAVTAEELAEARAKAPEARFFKAIITK